MLLSLVKTSTDEHSDRRLEREAQWLRELAEVPTLEGQVPRLLDEGWRDGHRFLVVSLPQAGARETRAFTSGHARFLASLGKARFRVGDFETAGCCRWLQGEIRNLKGTRPESVGQLEGAYRDCEASLLYWTGPYVLAQGDFAPWNIRTFGSQLFVFDWGEAHTDASPLDDVLHYLMIQRRLKTVPLLRRAMTRARDFALAAYPEWSWRPRVIGALTLVYLLGVILHRKADRTDPVVAAYWKLLEKRSTWMKEN